MARGYRGGWGGWDLYPTAPLRDAKDGIRARSRRGAIGDTWWSRRFVEVLESFRMGARLDRGRRYARRGQVMDLTVTPGRVTAKVQGTRRTPYAVRIDVRTLPEADWARVESALAAQAVHLARLLAGEMPEDIEDAFAACSLSLFPASTRELDTTCSCPDWANPCKHLAATYYILAEAFDEDPFLVLTWRGRTRDELLEHLRALRGASGPHLSADADTASGSAGEPGEHPLGDDLDHFWSTGTDLSDLVPPPAAPAMPAVVLDELGSPPGTTPAARRALAGAWTAMTERALERAYDDGRAVHGG